MSTIRRQRWLLKKAGRAGIGAVGTLGRLGRRGQGQVRVLTYHRFGEQARDPYCVSRQEFEAQMRFISEQQLAIGEADLLAFLAGERTVPANAVLVTTDDGFRSVLTEMLPILQRHRVPAIAFVSSGLIGTGRAGDADEPYLTWPEVRELAAAGVTIGSHAVHHRSLAQLAPAEQQQEAAGSKARIEQELGAAIASFAYPYGTLADFDQASADVLRAAGYRLGFTSQHGAIERGAPDWLQLPRVKVEAGDPGWLFPQLCHGALDVWRMVDTLLWRTQQAR